MLLRFNTFFTVTARLHAEADKKRALHELAACAPAVPDGPCRVPQCIAAVLAGIGAERSGVERHSAFMRMLLPHAERLGRAFPYTGERYRAP